ncbi:hypothetical protein A3L11_06395 [Thermococcus siculi]|uniref:Glycerophosphoryl diester phosphodiesterase membrane domain-containing protein n=1 Tax=Thermococcus siculi TaxID=72803 RepID=A0A2Z2MKH1_9EURY|nr:hypothetical protein [Thermococcus siculi]ASJ08872.1 hypothetical protein A3L11_06395 [Thermococcus siculi]
MGAIDAFVKTFSLILENKRLYLLALILALILAPIGAYLVPNELSYNYNQTSMQKGNVIVEEYGGPSEDELMDLFTQLMKGLAVYLLITMVLSSIFEYGVVKGALAHLAGEEPSLGELLGEGVRHFIGVFIINLIYSLIALAFIGVAFIPIAVGVMTLPAGGVLIFLGLVLLLPIAALVTSLSALSIPLYADKGKVGAAFEAFGLVFRNILSSIGFGFLMWVGIIGVGMISAPIAFVTEAFLNQGAGVYVSALLQAPFNALLYVFIWVAGVAFYKELQRMEELKKVDVELAELGIDI